MSTVYRTVAAWRQSLESVLAIGQRLSDAQWAAATECPDWTVKDIYAHLIGGELWMAEGHPVPPESVTEWAAAPVRARRDTAAAAVLEELRLVYERRRVQLESEPIDPAQPAHLASGESVPLELLLRVRVLDLWAHEQDIRRAVGERGNLDSPAAAVAGELFVAALPRIVAKSAQAPPGSSVRLTTTGEVEVDVVAVVGPDGRGAIVPSSGGVTAHLTMGWEAYTRLSCGRGAHGEHEVKITGDRDLAGKVLANLTITP